MLTKNKQNCALAIIYIIDRDVIVVRLLSIVLCNKFIKVLILNIDVAREKQKKNIEIIVELCKRK